MSSFSGSYVILFYILQCDAYNGDSAANDSLKRKNKKPRHDSVETFCSYRSRTGVKEAISITFNLEAIWRNGSGNKTGNLSSSFTVYFLVEEAQCISLMGSKTKQSDSCLKKSKKATKKSIGYQPDEIPNKTE